MADVKEMPVKIYSSIDDIVASGASEVEYALVDGFKPGEKARIGSVTAGDMIEWSEANEGEAKKNAGLRLICKSLVDENGLRFADTPGTLAKLKTMRHKETERIVREILKLNGMTVKEDKKEKND
jgi:hypothetical protein